LASPPSGTIRKFTMLWAASALWKLAALAAFVLLAAKLTGVGGP